MELEELTQSSNKKVWGWMDLRFVHLKISSIETLTRQWHPKNPPGFDLYVGHCRTLSVALFFAGTYSVSVAFPTSCTGRNCCDVRGFTSLLREDFVASLSWKPCPEPWGPWGICSPVGKSRVGIGMELGNHLQTDESSFYHACPEHDFSCILYCPCILYVYP